MFLYQGYILIFRASARPLSDWGANFMSIIINEMCKILGMKKLWSMPYHTHTNGLVKRLYQTIMRMIRKLGEDKKANWPGHLVEIVHAYNATQSTMTRYSPCYLMFGWKPRLSVDFYFPTFRSAEASMRGASAKCVDEYVPTVHDQLRATLWEAQALSMAEVQWEKWYYDQKIGSVDLKPGNLVLVKADVFQGKRKIKDRWEDEPCKVVHWIMIDIPSYKVTNQWGQSHILHHSWLLKCIRNWHFPVCGCPPSMAQMYQPTPVKPTPRGVIARIHHKRTVVWQAPNARPERLPWVGSMGSFGFYHGHPPEHPQRMSENFR